MSFKDSKIAAAANSAMTLSAELAVDTEEYTLCTDGRYEVYTKYQDNAYSTVDNLKNIAVDATQINIMQEENSQYMPFRIPRYWDGMDLMDMLIQIRYESIAEKKGKVATVINVASNNTYIRFGWLIDAAVTANAGDIIFEIMATGVNEKGNNYIWRTRPNGKFTVLQGLNYDGIIEPSEDWYTSFVNMILGHVAEAKQYADEAKASAASINVDDIKADVKTSHDADTSSTTITKMQGKSITLYFIQQDGEYTTDRYITESWINEQNFASADSVKEYVSNIIEETVLDVLDEHIDAALDRKLGSIDSEDLTNIFQGGN